MCTTMRKLRRGTPSGIVRKMFKRRITTEIKGIKRIMANGLVGDASGLIIKLGALIKLRKTIKI